MHTKAIEIGGVYANAHNAAVEALARYEETKALEEQELMIAQIDIATEALSKLLALIRPYLLNDVILPSYLEE